LLRHQGTFNTQQNRTCYKASPSHCCRHRSATILSPLEELGPDLSACCGKYLQTKISIRLGRSPKSNSEKESLYKMTVEQEQQLQNLDVEIQIDRKSTRLNSSHTVLSYA